MPWQEIDVHEQRVRFCLELESGNWEVTALCRAFGVSRKTGYKWWNRYLATKAEQEDPRRAAGKVPLDALKDLSRAPKGRPNETPSWMVEKIVATRKRWPRWGARKIRARLAREQGDVAWPAPSTVHEILRRNELVKERVRRRRSSATPSRSLTEARAPNDVWAVDFKGYFRLGDGTRCEPLTVTDQWSRYLINCRALTCTKAEDTRQAMVEAFLAHGLPAVILSDNGPPFASTGIGGLTRLSIGWLKLGIRVERIAPGQPQQNGKHERFHRTLKAAVPPRRSRSAQQRAFNTFQREYNEERPHESLGMKVPADVYEPSVREYPRHEPEDFEYQQGVETRRVRYSGDFKWRGERVFVSEVLRGELIGLVMTGDGIWDVSVGPLVIGTFNERASSFVRRREI